MKKNKQKIATNTIEENKIIKKKKIYRSCDAIYTIHLN